MEEEGLSSYEQAAKAHWERFLPQAVAAMNAKGPAVLATEIRAAAWLTEYHVLRAMSENPGLHRLQAEELFRNQWLWVPPEEPA